MTLVRNKNALRQAIHEAMLKYGPACDLNHLDIGRLHDLSFFSSFSNILWGYFPMEHFQCSVDGVSF